jgi:PAS domain S-box-containing protein
MLFAEEMQRDIEPNTDLERYVSIETEYYHADGQTVWMENSVKAIRGHSGAIIGIYGSSRDITDRKRVEAALIEGETQFRTLFESSPIGIGVVDHQGNLLLFNDAMLQSGGFSATDIQEIGNVAALYQNSDQRNEALKRFQEQGFLKNFPAQFKRKDGTYYDALLSLSHLHFRGKPCIQAIVQDITERKRTEEALQESQRRLSTLMSNLPGMAYRCMNDPNWTMEFVSDGCLPLTGYKPDELVGNAQLSYAEIIHPEDRQIVWDTVQAGLKTQRSFQLLYRIITASKNIKWVWEQGQGILGTENDVITLEGFITDITDRVQIESTLRENEARLKDAQRVAHVGNWELDLVTGKLWWSDEVYRIFGVQPQEFKATYDAFLSHVYPDDRDFVNDAYTASVKNNQPYNIVHRLQTKDGSIDMVQTGAKKVPSSFTI